MSHPITQIIPEAYYLVKIVRVQYEGLWYRNFVGKEYQVVKVRGVDTHYYLKYDLDHKKPHRRIIKVRDCEIVRTIDNPE